MRSNFEIPPSARAVLLGAGVLAGAYAVTKPETARAEEPATIESGDINLSLEGRVTGGIFTGTLDFGGWFTGTSITVKKPLVGLLTAEQLAQLEGQEVSAKVEGKITGGVFNGRLITNTPLHFDVPLTFSCAGLTRAPARACTSTGCARPASAKSRTARAVSPEPGAAPSTLKFVKPFDPGTYFPEKPDAGKSMGEGNPRGFDMGPSSPLKFFVTGPARIQLHLYPWVFVDKAERAKSGPLKVTVTIDGDDKREIPPQSLSAGKIFKPTKRRTAAGDVALWDQPLVLPPIDIPLGSHEIVVTSGGYGFRVMLDGAQETSKPDIAPAIERPFEEDPDSPASFRFPCRLDQDPEADVGLSLTQVAKSPLPIGGKDELAVAIERFHDDTLATVRLTRGEPGKPGHVVYGLSRPLEQVTDHMCEFERLEPPARSTDGGGPASIALAIKPDGTIDETVTGLGKPGTMDCRTHEVARSSPKRTHVTCWERILAARVRAYRTTLDARPATTARRHVLPKY